MALAESKGKVKTESEEDRFLESLISLCDDLAWCRPSSEEALYRLTNPLLGSPRLARLAEAFGLMLVRLEARSVELDDLMESLKSQGSNVDSSSQKSPLNRPLKQGSLAGTLGQDPILGQCQALLEVVEKAQAVSRYPINTMILGPTGSGKEALAKFIFFNSPRRGGDFVAVNCSAIPEALFESEMFGIEKGVATGVDRRPGLIEVADKGTLFLDEVGDMSLACQVKLLRVLEERRVRRVGARTSKEVDLHIISATNADLAAKVKAKLFREDLWYRLNVVELKLPALNTRGSDILLLAKHFLKIQAIRLNRPELTISDEVKDILMAYDWPGNIRELANEMERVTALAAGTEIKPQDLSEKLKALAASSSFASSPSTQSPNSSPLRPHKGDSSSTPPAPPDKLLKSISDRAVIETLALHDGNKTRAAKDLGLSREGLRKRLARIGPGLARGLK